MHTKGITKKLDHPHEPGEWVVIRKVSSGFLDLTREQFAFYRLAFTHPSPGEQRLRSLWITKDPHQIVFH